MEKGRLILVSKYIISLPIIVLLILFCEIIIRTIIHGLESSEYRDNFNYTSESVRFFCSFFRMYLIIFIFSALDKKNGIIVGETISILYILLLFFLPDKFYVYSFTIDVFKGFTAMLGCILGIIITHLYIKIQFK